MKPNKIFSLMLLLLICRIAAAQVMSPQEYIEKYKDLAIREMKRMGVPAAITLAQGLLETDNGNSVLLKKSNNHFGIKCKDSWTASGVSHDDDAKGECFRTYKDAEASYRDHSNFLRGGERYAFLFALDPKDYKGWARGLKKAGYATNPAYPDILIRNIEQYNLQQYSLLAAGEVPSFDRGKYTDDKEVKVDTTDFQTKDAAVAVQAPVTGSESLESRINGTRCIRAVKGTSLLLIATQYRIALEKLMSFNDMKADGLLQKDQYIYLQKKAQKGEKPFHIVQKGQTAWDVAQENGVQLKSVLEYNDLSENEQLVTGRKVSLVPGNTAIIPVKETKAIAKVHEVQPKEGLYAISKKYGVSVQQLRDWNGLPTDDLKIGQQLIVAQ